MTLRRTAIPLLFCVAALCGCETHDVSRFEGVYPGAGNATAANTVMQMVDPWPRGVEDTDLSVSADLDQYKPKREQAEGEPPAAAAEAESATTQY